MTKKLLYIVLATSGIAILSCKEQTKPVEKKSENSFSVNGSVREMKITPETPDFPDHEGKAEFVSYCSMCHSLKYITMQPNFPPKTWEAEVNKMVTKFKAPIDSVTGKKIVDYLVAVKSNH